MIEEEARTTGARAPDEVYATLEVNASVTEARGRRIMIIGVPLLHITSERGMRGIIAHEFGHYAGGDTRLGPWVWRTYDGVARTIDYLTDDDGDDGWTQRAVRQPFIWYGNAFMRITAAIKRRQEFAADQLAARSAGRDAYTEALRRIHAYGPSFDAYWENEVAAVLRAGRRPPVVHGFGEYLRSEPIDKAASEFLELQMKEETDRYDSHPSLIERIAALQECAPGEPDGSPPAMKLVRDPAELERSCWPSSSTPRPPSCPPSSGTTSPTRCTSHGRAACAPSTARCSATRRRGPGRLAQDIGPIAGALRRREPSCPTTRRTTSPRRCSARRCGRARGGRLDGRGRLAEPVHACRGDDASRPTRGRRADDGGPAAAAWHERAAGSGSPSWRCASETAAKAEAPRTTKAPGRHPGPSHNSLD